MYTTLPYDEQNSHLHIDATASHKLINAYVRARTHTPHVFLEKAYQVCPLVPSPVSLLDFFPLSGAGLYSPSSSNARRWKRVGLERGTGKRWYPASLLPPPASAFFVRRQAARGGPSTHTRQPASKARKGPAVLLSRTLLLTSLDGATRGRDKATKSSKHSTQQHQTLFVTMINSLTFCTSCRLQVRGANSLRGEYRGAFSSSFIFALCV